MSNNSSGSGGIGFGSALTLVFIILKLTDVIDWSWVWVLAPLWIGLALFVAFMGVSLLLMFGTAFFTLIFKK